MVPHGGPKRGDLVGFPPALQGFGRFRHDYLKSASGRPNQCRLWAIPILHIGLLFRVSALTKSHHSRAACPSTPLPLAFRYQTRPGDRRGVHRAVRLSLCKAAPQAVAWCADAQCSPCADRLGPRVRPVEIPPGSMTGAYGIPCRFLKPASGRPDSPPGSQPHSCGRAHMRLAPSILGTLTLPGVCQVAAAARISIESWRVARRCTFAGRQTGRTW